MNLQPIQQLSNEKEILECLALSVLAGLARLFLIEKTIVGGLKQFFGGLFFGSLIGYLTNVIEKDSIYYLYTGKIWRVWSVVCAIFGREILSFFKITITQISPLITNFMIKQGKRIAAAYTAYKNFTTDENDN